MKIKHTLLMLAAVSAFGSFVAPAHAANGELLPIDQMFLMGQIDKNKDGMVSKEEFMKTMEKVWDMKAAEMKVKKNKMSGAEIDQLLMYLKAGK